jgi:hypothetical protein
MAVKSPFHAILAAHFQASYNRARREMARSSAWVVLLIIVALGLVGFLPASLWMGAMGYFAGRDLHLAYTPAILGTFLTLMPLFMGFFEGVFAGGRMLSWEAHRAFPLSNPTLVACEIAAGAGSLNFLIIGCLTLCFFVGASLARPGLAPLFALWWAWGGLIQILSVQLSGSLAAAALRRLRFAFVVLVMGASVLPMALNPSLGRPRTRDRGARTNPLVATVRTTAETFRRTTRFLPGVVAVQGGVDLAEVRIPRGLGSQVPLLALLALLAGLVTRLMAWENRSPRAPARLGPERLWTFRTRRGGLARLHLRCILGSYLGRFTFLVPLLTPLLIRVLFRHSGGAERWALPGSLAYVLLASNTLLYNQFGLDRHGIKSLFILPLRGTDLLAGKRDGLLAQVGLLGGLTLALNLALFPFHWASLGGGVALAVGLLAVHMAAGQWTSIWMPRSIPWDQFRGSNMATAVAFTSMGISALAMGTLGGLYALLAWLAPLALVPVMAVLAAALWLAYDRLALPALGRYLDAHRERMLHALEG